MSDEPTIDIEPVWPAPAAGRERAGLGDAEILDRYAMPDGPWLRMNFVSSLDGAVTRDGRSGGLGDAADQRVFELLRWPSHAVLVGAGTVRAEGYEAMRVPDAAVRWRRERGLTPHPVFALVSGRLDLDPASPVFTDAPVRPIVYTLASAPTDRRAALSAVADVVDAGETELDPRAIRLDLEARGLTHVQAEGGPHLFGAFVAAGAVDELCLTLAPSIEAGGAGRIAASPQAAPTGMALASILRAGDELLLRYTRRDAAGL